MKQSEDAEAQVSGLKKELEQAQATLQASKDAAKVADSEKVGGERFTCMELACNKSFSSPAATSRPCLLQYSFFRMASQRRSER